jgi:hypothetical protein
MTSPQLVPLLRDLRIGIERLYGSYVELVGTRLDAKWLIRVRGGGEVGG